MPVATAEGTNSQEEAVTHYYVIDIEGDYITPLEISILEVERGEIIAVFHRHGIPPNMEKALRDNSSKSFRFSEAPYSHGIDSTELSKITNLTSKKLIELALKFLSKDIVVISNDKNPNSDIANLFRKNNFRIRYKNIYLGDWADRDTNASHEISRIGKFNNRPILGVSCNFNRLHRVPLFFRKTTNTAKKKLLHGAHCSLYDCLEIFEAIRNREVTLSIGVSAHEPVSSLGDMAEPFSDQVSRLTGSSSLVTSRSPLLAEQLYRAPRPSALLMYIKKNREMQNGRFEDKTENLYSET